MQPLTRSPRVDTEVFTALPAQATAQPRPETAAHRGNTDSLTGDDVRNLNAVLEHEIADNTRVTYQTQWLRFAEWTQDRGVCTLPATPAHVAAYLAERLEQEGHRPATLRTVAAAIGFVHRTAGWPDPCAAPEVRRALSGATRKAGRRQKQAAAITSEVMARIQAMATAPRPAGKHGDGPTTGPDGRGAD